MTASACWDEELAGSLVGCTVIVGISYLRPGGALDRQEQLHGVVVSVHEEAGIEIALSGLREGETYWLPPQTNTFEAARPGSYRLRSTGEEVIDPDYTTAWVVELPLQ